MHILSIGKTLQHHAVDIISIEISELASHPDIDSYDYIIISGGDGSIRRVIKTLQNTSIFESMSCPFHEFPVRIYFLNRWK